MFVPRKTDDMTQKNLAQGGILGNIATFSLPYMLAYFLQILYGLADLFVIGQYCGVESTTAVSIGAQVMHMLTVVIIGLAMGTTVHIARTVGANDAKKTSQVIGSSVTIFLLLSVVLTALLLFLTDKIVDLLDTPATAVNGTVSYLTICFAGIPFIVAYNVIASVYRGLGDSRSPMYFVMVACVVNIALDYLFIGYMGLGARGAALGTTLSQMASVIFALFAIKRGNSLLHIRRQDLRLQRRISLGILKIGLPVALQDGFIQVAFIAITIIANGRGLNDAAAVGIVEKFIGLLFIVPSAMLATVSTMSAQNIGAGKADRARSTLKYCTFVSTGFGLAAAIVLQFIPQLAIRIFTDDAQVIVLGGEYLQGYSWDCALAGIHFCFSGFFTACGLSVISFCHNFLSIVCARVPLSYVASQMFPTTLLPMGLATSAGSLLSVVICIAVYMWMMRHGKFAIV